MLFRVFNVIYLAFTRLFFIILGNNLSVHPAKYFSFLKYQTQQHFILENNSIFHSFLVFEIKILYIIINKILSYINCNNNYNKLI